MAVLKIDAAKVTGRVSPMLYGLMTEEINYSYEGGIYGELIRNRTFKASAQNPMFWSAVGEAAMTLDTNQPLNAALNVSLKLDAAKASKTSPVGIANEGFWEFPSVQIQSIGYPFTRAEKIYRPAEDFPRKYQR